MRGFRCFTIAFFLTFSIAAGATQAHAQTQVALGNAIMALNGPWKFHIGDNPQWASPAFDDSGWSLMDLTSVPGSVDPSTGESGFVPGWTARGYAGYSGYAWYRLRVNVQEAAQATKTALALKMPGDFDDAYQVYVNGKLVGQFGRFTEHGVTWYRSKPRAFPLPTHVLSANGSGPATIAIRMWMDASTPLLEKDAGGLHGPPDLGQASVIDALLRLHWDTLFRRDSSLFLVIATESLVVLLAFCLLWFDRDELAYLWLGLSCISNVVLMIFVVVPRLTTWISGTSFVTLMFAVLPAVHIGLWVLFWGYWFRLGRTAQMVRLYRITWGLVLLQAVGSSLLSWPLYGPVVPIHAIEWLSPLTLAFNLLLGVILVWVIYQGIRRDRTEGWLALPAVVLGSFAIYWQSMATLQIPLQFIFFGVYIYTGTIVNFSSLAIITVLVLRRFLHGQRQREQWKAEIEQARQVQQVLIPEAVPSIPGFTVESEYRPAQHVGGDFFQVLPGKDGSIVAVVGDVSGKGLKAAMLVSLIVGTVRTLAKFTRDPMEMLQGLNERLSGRMQGHFATCVVLHIAANGEATIANAGHLAPYLNGEEVAIAGSLPLGIADAAEFEQVRFTLQPGDRLTLMTDGVVEATNEKRELFGFERTQQISIQRAAAIADTAKAFGQQDDITVVTVTRTANREVAIA